MGDVDGETRPDFGHYRYLLWEQGNPVFFSAYWIKQPLRGDSSYELRTVAADHDEVMALADSLEKVDDPKAIGIEFETRYSHAVYRIRKDPDPCKSK